MNISLDSKKILNILINKFDKKHLKRNALQQKNNDNINRILYNDIRLSYKHVSFILQNNLMKKNLVEINSLQDIPKTDLLNSSFVPKSIKGKSLNPKDAEITPIDPTIELEFA